MTLLTLAAALALAQEPAPPQDPAAPPQVDLEPAAEGEGRDVFSFGRVQASARLGFAAFSEDFEADPEFLAGVAARVDWPWMSRDVLGFDEDRIGLFADVGVSQIDRDLAFLDDRDGTVLFVGFGADVRVYEDESWIARGQAGGQYGHFGGVDDTDNGVAGLLGLDLGLRLDEALALQLNPQVAFGNGGDQVYLLTLGLQYRF